MSKALPWVYGTWNGEDSLLSFFPDGYYREVSRTSRYEGVGWTIRRATKNTFILEYGQRRFVVRNDRDMTELLNEDGSVKARLPQYQRLEGQFTSATPHGTWMVHYPDPSFLDLDPNGPELLEYRNGELIDARWLAGGRDFGSLNATRRAHGLRELTESDFDTAGEKP